MPHINSGTIYSARGERERALEAYLKGLELDPTRRLAYTNAFAKYLQLDKVDEAEKLVKRQVEAVGETPDTDLFMYEIAARRRDRTASDRYAARLEGTSRELNFLGLRSAELAFYGQLRESRRVNDRYVELLKRQGLNERVPAALANMAAGAAFLGERELAREQARAAEALESSLTDFRANLAFTYAVLGDGANARRHFTAATAQPIPDAQPRSLFDDVFNAVVALYTNRPQDAVKRLETIPEDRNVSVVVNGLLTRAEAFLALGRLEEAERDYRSTLAHPPPGVFHLAFPLAHVGLARTLAARGNTAGARDEYKKFLDLWHQADEDLVLLQQVKAEVAKLGT